MQFSGVAKTGLLCGSLLYSGWAYADAPMALIDCNGFMLRAHLHAGLNAVPLQDAESCPLSLSSRNGDAESQPGISDRRS